MRRILLFCACALFLSCFAAAAKDGEGWKKFVDGYYRFDDKIRKFLMDGMDTAYVALPANSWEVPLAGKMYSYNTSVFSSSQEIGMDTGTIFEVGAGIGYHGLDLVYTQAVGRSMVFNFEFDYYDNYWGLGINIGKQNFGREIYGEAAGGEPELQSRQILLDGYYAVFGNRYSYPAAIYGNYIQKKSAGSPLVSFWYEHIDYTPYSDKARTFFSDRQRQHLDEGAIMPGYGYNVSIEGGKVTFNMSAGVGINFPYVGLAATGRFSVMVWINDHFRVNFFYAGFFQKSWSEKNMRMQDNTMRSGLNLTYCFGMPRSYVRKTSR